MKEIKIHTIDLNFQSRKGTIGTYLVPHSGGGILVETGPGSTLDSLTTGLQILGFTVQDITDIFLTHIHLDHAGAAGWWANQGTRIHVHEFGAPHMINPEKLLASANRLYGDLMDTLWGEFIPVPEEHINVVHDQEIVQINDLSIQVIDVPGHASHHVVYIIGDTCFSGDIGGIRLSPRKYIRLPMVPPEFHLEKWRESIIRIQKYQPNRIAPTHFGVYSDAKWHLQAVLNELDEVEKWIETTLPLKPTLEVLRRKFIEFEIIGFKRYGIEKEAAEAQQIANPSFLSADGIFRYWNKYRKPDNIYHSP